MSSVLQPVGDARRDLRKRSTREVLEDHLALALAGDLETDLARNFAEDCVILTGAGLLRGHEGCREAARLLEAQVGEARLTHDNAMWHGELAFLEWRAGSPQARIDDGADSYWIRDGRIEAVTIRYTVHPRAH